MLDIDIDYTSLSEAVGDLRALEDTLAGGTELRYRSQALVDASQGTTCDALNNLYSKLAEYQLELIALIGKTRAVMTSIGITFAEAENDSMQENIQGAG